MARPGLATFERFCRALVLDNGQPLQLNAFQRWLLEPFFAGASESILSTPKGAGKSTLLGALALFELLLVPESEIIVCAASRDQASVLLGQAQGFVRRSPSLARRVRVTRREVHCPALHGRLRVISADANTGDGLIPSLVLPDELHRWRNADLFETLQTALSKRGGRMLTISTAGEKDDACPLWPIRERALELGARRDGVRLSADSADGAFALRELSAPGSVDWRDLDIAAAVNPLVARDALAQRLASPTQTERSWRRYTLNQWLDPVSDAAPISPETWALLADGAFESVPPACFGFDVSPDRSTACIAVATFDGPASARRVGVEIVEHGPGAVWVVDRLVELDGRHNHVGVVVDGIGPAGTLIPRLEEFGVDMHVLTGRDYARACQGFVDLVTEDRLRHSDQAPLNLAVQAAGRRKLTDGFAWSRTNSLGDISPLVAASIAAHGLMNRGPVSEEAFHAIG